MNDMNTDFNFEQYCVNDDIMTGVGSPSGETETSIIAGHSTAPEFDHRTYSIDAPSSDEFNMDAALAEFYMDQAFNTFFSA